MKKCFIIFFIFISACSFAQDKKQFVELLLKNNTNRINNADKHFKLPNVSLPCLVADLTAMAVMPVLRFAGTPSAIPNPYTQTEQLPGTINNYNKTPGINFYQKKEKGLSGYYTLPAAK
mgnify:CR=1 FL=1